MVSSPPPTYSTLSFSAILNEEYDANADLAPLKRTVSSTPALPLAIDLNFDFGFEDSTFKHSMTTEDDGDDLEIRSPRSPTFSNRSPHSPITDSPFDPSRFFEFLLDPPSSNESSPLLPRQSLAAGLYLDLPDLDDASKENLPSVLPPPKRALPWIWTCHLCHSRYPLGATRRCLIDGHFYCSGDSGGVRQRNVKRKKKGQSCSSEFDYTGWQAWEDWKREVIALKQQALTGTRRARPVLRLRGCEGCAYPSQCRYEKLNKYPDVVPAPLKSSRTGSRGDAGTEHTSSKQRASEKKRHDLTIDTDSQPVSERVEPRQDKDRSLSKRNLRSDSTQTEHVSEVPKINSESRTGGSDHEGGGQRSRQETRRTSNDEARNASVDRPKTEGINSHKVEPPNKSGLKQSRIVDFFRISK